MFGRKFKEEPEEFLALPAPQPPPHQLAANPGEGFLPEGTVVEGGITTGTPIVVGGVVKGHVHAAGRVRVGASATVKGNVHAPEVWIAGRVEGEVVTPGKLTVMRGGQVLGDVRARSLTVEDGGQMQGRCLMGAEAPVQPATAHHPQPAIPRPVPQRLEAPVPALAPRTAEIPSIEPELLEARSTTPPPPPARSPTAAPGASRLPPPAPPRN